MSRAAAGTGGRRGSSRRATAADVDRCLSQSAAGLVAYVWVCLSLGNNCGFALKDYRLANWAARGATGVCDVWYCIAAT